MKKRIVKLLFIGVAISVLASCGEVSEAPEEEEEIEEVEDENDDEDEDEPEADTETVTDETAPEMTYALSRYRNSDTIYFFDPEGKLSAKASRNDIAEKLDDDYKEYIETTDGYSKNSLAAYGDGFLFFQDTIPGDPTGEYLNRVYATTAEGNKTYLIWRESTDMSISSVDYYNGRLYIDHATGYDETGRYAGYDESVFVYDPAQDLFEEEENEISPVLEAVNDKDYVPRASRITPLGQSGSFFRSVDETGFLLCYSQEDGYQIVNMKGKSQKLKVPENVSYLEYYDAGHVFYLEWDDTYSNNSAYIYDIKSGRSTAVSGDEDYVTMLGRSGSRYFYSVNRSEEYGLDHNYIYEYNADEDSCNLLYDVEKTPGSVLSPGTESFTIAGDCIYFLGFDDGNDTWIRYSLTDGITPKSTGVVERHNSTFDYGTVGYLSNTYECPDCGTPLTMTYCEYFELDDSLSEHAEDIDEYLLSVAVLAVGTDDADTGYGESCEEHQENPTWYQVTDEKYISGIELIDDRYLAVNTSGYWYAGGAHGMPFRYQYLFDLETGEVMTLADFYEGDEDEFIELIAQKTKEDFLSYDYYMNPYFAMDENEAYEDALEYVSLKAASADFTQDGIWYYYSPYMMGPYASGYIDIFVSYEELFGRPTLAE